MVRLKIHSIRGGSARRFSFLKVKQLFALIINSKLFYTYLKTILNNQREETLRPMRILFPVKEKVGIDLEKLSVFNFELKKRFLASFSEIKGQDKN